MVRNVFVMAVVVSLCGIAGQAEAGFFGKLKCKLRSMSCCKVESCCEVESSCGCETTVSDCGCGGETVVEEGTVIEYAEPTEASPADALPAVPEPPAEEPAAATEVEAAKPVVAEQPAPVAEAAVEVAAEVPAE